MGTKLVVCCDMCETIIKNPNDGFLVIGNVGEAYPPQAYKYLIGNNIPEPLEDGTIIAHEINQQYFCKLCLCKALNIVCASVRTDHPDVPKQIWPINQQFRTATVLEFFDCINN